MADAPLHHNVPHNDEKAIPSDQPPPSSHHMDMHQPSLPAANPSDTSSMGSAATATAMATNKSNQKAESVKSFSSSTSSSSSYRTIQVDGKNPPAPGAKASQQAHALPVKDFIYKVPAPLPDNHPSNIAAKRQQRRCNPCMRRFACIASLIFTVVLLLAIAILLFYLIARPQLPKIDIEALTVAEFNITDSSARNANYAGYIKADMVMKIRMRNMNKKMRVTYADVKGEVSYAGLMISQASIEASGVHQNARNTTSVQLEMHAERVDLSKNMAESMKRSLAANASQLPVQVSTSANVALQLGAWKSRHIPLHATCSAHIAVGVATPAKSALIPNSCVASHPKLPFLLLLPST
ncbi:hypothetical protein GOP47_0024149 [Adiantum capillus-veneris]|uniref:Late embryogenesis abundant protein LEA-2 subgroup domain-containing protein n=1 Tax=Adiantum capillus-veneris TaxID=13818 RepID=A0A9D4Z544_ADICA|nr:hypothetical protein GOP47_0024149 [Adiantum capillus-veneris]